MLKSASGSRTKKSSSRDVIVGKKFKLGKKVGGGSFGDIYGGTNIYTKDQVAIKLELKNQPHPQLPIEYKIYHILGEKKGIPKIHFYGVEGDYNVLIMDLLEADLETFWQKCSRKFSLRTTILLAVQLIDRMEYLHSKNFIHRDIKPDNFLMGKGDNSDTLYMIDLGLAKRFIDPRTGKHIAYREQIALTGTVRYASLNTHLGIEQGRRDDLESIGYCLIYWYKGGLPWQGLTGCITMKERYEKIAQKKMVTTVEDLCKDTPEAFATYMNYCRSLYFNDKPDYDFLRKIFTDLQKEENIEEDLVWDWTEIMAAEKLEKPEGKENGDEGKDSKKPVTDSKKEDAAKKGDGKAAPGSPDPDDLYNPPPLEKADNAKPAPPVDYNPPPAAKKPPDAPASDDRASWRKKFEAWKTSNTVPTPTPAKTGESDPPAQEGARKPYKHTFAPIGEGKPAAPASNSKRYQFNRDDSDLYRKPYDMKDRYKKNTSKSMFNIHRPSANRSGGYDPFKKFDPPKKPGEVAPTNDKKHDPYKVPDLFGPSPPKENPDRAFKSSFSSPSKPKPGVTAKDDSYNVLYKHKANVAAEKRPYKSFSSSTGQSGQSRGFSDKGFSSLSPRVLEREATRHRPKDTGLTSRSSGGSHNSPKKDSARSSGSDYKSSTPFDRPGPARHSTVPDPVKPSKPPPPYKRSSDSRAPVTTKPSASRGLPPTSATRLSTPQSASRAQPPTSGPERGAPSAPRSSGSSSKSGKIDTGPRGQELPKRSINAFRVFSSKLGSMLHSKTPQPGASLPYKVSNITRPGLRSNARTPPPPRVTTASSAAPPITPQMGAGDRSRERSSGYLSPTNRRFGEPSPPQNLQTKPKQSSSSSSYSWKSSTGAYAGNATGTKEDLRGQDSRMPRRAQRSGTRNYTVPLKSGQSGGVPPRQLSRIKPPPAVNVGSTHSPRSADNNDRSPRSGRQRSKSFHAATPTDLARKRNTSATNDRNFTSKNEIDNLYESFGQRREGQQHSSSSQPRRAPFSSSYSKSKTTAEIPTRRQSASYDSRGPAFDPRYQVRPKSANTTQVRPKSANTSQKRPGLFTSKPPSDRNAVGRYGGDRDRGDGHQQSRSATRPSFSSNFKTSSKAPSQPRSRQDRSKSSGNSSFFERYSNYKDSSNRESNSPRRQGGGLMRFDQPRTAPQRSAAAARPRTAPQATGSAPRRAAASAPRATGNATSQQPRSRQSSNSQQPRRANGLFAASSSNYKVRQQQMRMPPRHLGSGRSRGSMPQPPPPPGGNRTRRPQTKQSSSSSRSASGRRWNEGMLHRRPAQQQQSGGRSDRRGRGSGYNTKPRVYADEW